MSNPTYPPPGQQPVGQAWGAPPPPAPQQPKKIGKVVGFGCLGCLGFLVFFGIIGALVGSGDSSSPGADDKPTVSGPETTGGPERDEDGPTEDADDATAALANLVGMGLQTAQDTAQEAGFYSLTSHDSLGRDRNQFLDRDWQVCFQNPAPGEHPTDTKVDLGVVKVEEKCPAKDGAAPEEVGSTMPDFKGQSVKATRGAFDSSTSITVEDASGDGRIIIMESDWRVCTQDPKAGAAVTGQPVRFTAVKFEESCP